MRVRVVRTCLLALAAASLVAWWWTYRQPSAEPPQLVAATTDIPVAPDPTVTLCVVCCGNERVHETLTMLKSAILLTRAPLRAIVLAEDALHPAFEEKLAEWQVVAGDRLTRYEVRPLRFPEERAEEWRRLFKPCAAQRLFLPSVLTDVDAVLYVDTDVLFVDGPERTWRYFSRMNDSQIAALAPEHHDPNVGWYNRFARHPYYPPLGVNSGVMLMNLTRMRQFAWTEYLGPVYARYRLRITWGDQDIINIIFHHQPHRLLVYGCEFNLRPDHCMYGAPGGGCPAAERDGAAVVHGSRGFFHRPDRQPAFAALYDHFQQYQLSPESDMMRDLVLPLEATLDSMANTTCGRMRQAFTRPIRQRAIELTPQS